MLSYSTGKEKNFSHSRTPKLLESKGEYGSMKYFYPFKVLSFCMPILSDKTLVSLPTIFTCSNSFFANFSCTSIKFRNISDKMEDENND